MKIVVGYGRVSSNEQALNQNALKQQLDRLKTDGVDKILCDVESGADDSRKNFVHLMDEIRSGRVAKIKATRWDRLMRSEEAYLALKGVLQEYGVQLYLLDQGMVDLETASGLLSADMNAIFAVHERRMLKERVQSGQAFRRKNKEAWSRQPFGYTTENKKYVLDDYPIVCLISRRPENYQELCLETDLSKLPGISRSQIARESIEMVLVLRKPRSVLRKQYAEYGIPRKTHTNAVLSDELLLWSLGSSFTDWIKNPVLRGHTAYQKYKKTGGQKPESEWEVNENTHPDQRLISDQEYDEILSILASNAKKVGTPGATFYLTGLVYCQECGQRCVLKRGPSYRYYGCRHSGMGCSNKKNVRVEKLDEAVIQACFERAVAFVASSDATDQEDVNAKEVAELKRQLQGIEDLLKISPNPVLQQALRDLFQQIEVKVNPTRAIAFDQATAENLIQHPQSRDLAFWYTLTEDDRNIIYEKLVDRITIQDGQVTAVKLNV